MSRWFVAVPAAGAASIHCAAAVTAVDGGIAAALAVVAAVELAIAVGVAIGARRLPAAPTLVLALVFPVLAWATLLLVAVTADAPQLAGALATVPLAAASVLGLIAAASAGADARRTRVGARVRPARGVFALAAAAALTLTITAPAVGAALPQPSPAAPVGIEEADTERSPGSPTELGSHDGHEGALLTDHSGHAD